MVEFDIVVGKSSNASVGNIEAALKEGNSTGILEYTLIGEIDIKEVQESSTAVVPTRTLLVILLPISLVILPKLL